MKPKVVGFLVDNLLTAGNYQSSLWLALSQAAAEQSVSLITVVGGAIASSTTDEFEICRNNIYSLVRDAPVDGLIIPGTLGSYQTALDLERFHRQFSMPTVSIGAQLPGVPCVSVDNYSGTRRIVEHLLSIHECRRVAFLKGPSGAPEATRRFDGYREALERFGIPIDPDLLFAGNYLPDSGEAMVASMTDDELRSLDGIVGANDNMALGVMRALRQRGISVPGDIVVAGFDDTEESAVVSPPLTTIRQPREQLARTALKTLLSCIDGETVPGLLEIQTELVVRTSCGCRVDPGLPDIRPVSDVQVTGTERPRPIDRAAVYGEVAEALGVSAEHHQIGNGILERVVESFISELETSDLNVDFGREIDALNDHLLQHSDDTQYSVRVVSVLHRCVIPWLADAAMLRHATELIQTALSKASQANLHWAISRRLMLEQASQQLHGVSRSIMSQFDMQNLLNSIEEHLPSFGIRECYVVLRRELFEEDARPGAHRLIRAIGDSVDRTDESDRDFSFDEVVRLVGNRGPDVSFLAETLWFREHIYGYIVVGCNPEQRLAVESMIVQVCSALNGWMLFREQQKTQQLLQERLAEIRDMNDRLEELSTTDELTGLYNRRGFRTLAEQQLLVSRRKRERLLVLYIDMDHLKQINDQHGHDAGDEAIAGMADRISGTLRDSDIVARLGGDEFVAIAIDTNLQMAGAIEDKLQHALSGWASADGTVESLRCTIGFAEFNPDAPANLDTLLSAADRDLLEKRRLRSEREGA